jgi:tetratricopeptide (TPR) repeat protein
VACTVGTVRGDEVLLVPGATLKEARSGRVLGTVQSESSTEVIVKLGSNTVTVPADQVATIRYTGQPATVALAESRESAGQLGEAADLYKKAAAEASSKPLVEQAARFKQAEVTADLALADPTRAADAVALLEKFVTAYPATRHTTAALEALARLQIQKGDVDAAGKTISSLEKLPAGADRAALLRARVLARQGDRAKALDELDRLIKSAPAGSARGLEAKLSHAENLAGLGKFPEAEAEVRGVIKGLPAEDAPGQSLAYNTLGDCLRAAGRPKDALIAYLHTDVLYAKDKEQHPRALARIAQLWRQLDRGDRADEVAQRLRQEYPQSPWATGSPPNP